MLTNHHLCSGGNGSAMRPRGKWTTASLSNFHCCRVWSELAVHLMSDILSKIKTAVKWPPAVCWSSQCQGVRCGTSGGEYQKHNVKHISVECCSMVVDVCDNNVAEQFKYVTDGGQGVTGPGRLRVEIPAVRQSRISAGRARSLSGRRDIIWGHICHQMRSSIHY